LSAFLEHDLDYDRIVANPIGAAVKPTVHLLARLKENSIQSRAGESS
jgi:hypothetical protein